MKRWKQVPKKCMYCECTAAFKVSYERTEEVIMGKCSEKQATVWP